VEELTMSKNAILGLAAILCVVAAGVGAYIATQQAPVQISAPEAGVSIAPETLAANSNPAPQQGAVPPAQAVAPGVPPPSQTYPMPTTPRATVPPAVSSSGPPSGAQAPPATLPQDGLSAMPERPSPPVYPTTAPVSTVPAMEPAVPQPQAPPPPPEPAFDELVISAEAVLGLSLDSTVNSETARVEDPVEARVTREVRVGSRVAVPANTRVLGSVAQVEKGGKMKTKARLAVRFHTLVLADGTRTPIQTDMVFREGDSPGQEAAGKVGAAAAGGAILGAIFGGGKGAAIGGSIGAGAGAATVMAGKRNPAVLPAGTAVTVRLLQPVSVMVER
jgi:hypothetical protein